MSRMYSKWPPDRNVRRNPIRKGVKNVNSCSRIQYARKIIERFLMDIGGPSDWSFIKNAYSDARKSKSSVNISRERAFQIIESRLTYNQLILEIEKMPEIGNLYTKKSNNRGLVGLILLIAKANSIMVEL